MQWPADRCVASYRWMPLLRGGLSLTSAGSYGASRQQTAHDASPDWACSPRLAVSDPYTRSARRSTITSSGEPCLLPPRSTSCPMERPPLGLQALRLPRRQNISRPESSRRRLACVHNVNSHHRCLHRLASNLEGHLHPPNHLGGCRGSALHPIDSSKTQAVLKTSI